MKLVSTLKGIEKELGTHQTQTPIYIHVRKDDVALKRHRRYVAAYLALPGVSERVRVQGFGLPDGNLWVVRPCSLTDEQRHAAVDKVRAVMAEKVMELPRLSREEAATLGRSMPRFL